MPSPKPSAKTRQKKTTTAPPQEALGYRHPTADSPLRPDVGTQAQFRKKKPPATYRYDSSLSPALNWDGQNPARELGEAHLATIDRELAAARARLAKVEKQVGKSPEMAGVRDELKEAVASLQAAADAHRQLAAMGKPFLDWTGKAERLSFDVPTLPLFVHERLSTAAIIDTLRGHKRDQQLALFADPQRSIADQVLKAYEHRDQWVNRMVLGDSMVVMNSLLQYEGLGGQVQMIYMDPPYGVKFGSNFQPFVRKRDVSHNDDEDMTREPEMVKAYRDTWELGLHSYLTYMRDRLMLARELLTESGSIFVQISAENVHHVRELIDEIFGSENYVATIAYKTAIGMTSGDLDEVFDNLIWFARDKSKLKFRRLFTPTAIGKEGASRYKWIESPNNAERRMMSDEERDDPSKIPAGWKAFRDQGMTSRTGSDTTTTPFEYLGRVFRPRSGGWRTNPAGLKRLAENGRLLITGDSLSYKKFYDDFPALAVTNMWTDTGGGITSRSDPKIYAVQTSNTVIQRCVLMTTDPGDLVFDPTCGSGTTAYVAEQRGRRWITADVSRVPLALARQRLLTATFDWYELKDADRGPAGGFVYKRRQNKRGEEVGGIVPHVTLKNIANNEPPDEEVLVDRPEEVRNITRVTGPFTFEASIPATAEWEAESSATPQVPADGSFADRMLEVLRHSPLLHLGGGKSVTLRSIRPPAKTLSLSAEAIVEGHAPGTPLTPAEAVRVAEEASGRALAFTGRPVALVFGPESGAVSETLVNAAAREAAGKNYTHLYVIGFAVQANARQLIESCEAVYGVAATYVQATPDVLMGDLLKNMRSSQIFSVCGLPEVEVVKAKEGKYQAKLLGVDVFDPSTMENDHRTGDDVPAWLLDTDYNGLCFHVCQAFFPRTAAWDNLKKALKGTYEEGVWDHLAGSTSAPFECGDHRRIAVKVIDDRGNELMVVKEL